MQSKPSESSMDPLTHLRGKIPPFCNSLVVHSHTPNSSQDDILGNLHSQTSHTRNKDVGVLHALHGIMAQNIAESGVQNQQQKNTIL